MNQALMKQTKSKRSETKLNEVRLSFNRWRRTRHKKGPIPKELWEAAMELTKFYPKSVVCNNLRLGYRELKRKMAEYEGASKELEKTSESAVKTFFIEIPQRELNQRESMEIEMENGRGARLKMRCLCSNLVNAMGFWQVLLESQS